MPYGYADGERGTFFIAYSRSPEITERMLENMFIGDPPGNTDRLLDFTTAVTGSQYYAPPGDFLDDPPPPPGGSAAASAEPTPVATTPAPEPTEIPARSDGSLGIGSLH
jgi:putative iron-dependent peroxidase